MFARSDTIFGDGSFLCGEKIGFAQKALRSKKAFMTKKILMMVLAAMISLPLTAQIWDTYNTDNSNIVGNTVLAVAVDSRGNKWIGTNAGMCKLAGRAWTDYSMYNEKLRGQYVNCLTMDKTDRLWIGTDDYGMLQFDGVGWEEYTADAKRLNMKFVRDIAIDARGEKWIGVTLGGFVHFDGKTWTKYTAKDSDLLSDFVLCVAIDKDDMKWVGTNEGISVFDGKTWYNYTPQNSKLPSKQVPSIVVDDNNVKWIATLGGLCRHDGRHWQIYNTSNSDIPSNQVNDLVLDKKGVLWMTTEKGVAAFDGLNWVLYNKENSGLPIDAVKNITVDKKNCKWFGTDFYGITSFGGHTIMGCVRDEQGVGIPDVEVKIGQRNLRTDSRGYYRTDVAAGCDIVITPKAEGKTFAPPSISINNVSGLELGRDFVVATPALAANTTANTAEVESTTGRNANSNPKPAPTGKVTVKPYLEQGYITISFDGTTAEVEIRSASKVVRTIPAYKNGSKINISKYPKGTYKITVRTSEWEKTVTINKKH